MILPAVYFIIKAMQNRQELQVVDRRLILAGQHFRALETDDINLRYLTLSDFQLAVEDDRLTFLNQPHQGGVQLEAAQESAETNQTADIYLQISQSVGWIALDLIPTYYPYRRNLFLESWRSQANCLDKTDLYITQNNNIGESEIVNSEIWSICQGCSVRNTCFERGIYAREYYGVYGGYTVHVLRKVHLLRRTIINTLLKDDLQTSIKEFDFSFSTIRALNKASITTLGNLLNYPDRQLAKLFLSTSNNKILYKECKQVISDLIANCQLESDVTAISFKDCLPSDDLDTRLLPQIDSDLDYWRGNYSEEESLYEIIAT